MGFAMRLTVLNEEQVEKLHQGSLRLLETVGVHVPHDEMLSRFAAARAKVDAKRQQVRLPPELVTQCLAQAGRQFVLYGRDRARRAEFGLGRRNYNSIAGEACWLDEATSARRYARLGDVATAARLGDALPDLTIVGAMADPQEVPPTWRCVAVAAELLKHTTKPITFWFHDRASARYILELFAAVAGSEAEAAHYPFACPFLEPISPLRLPHHGIDLLFETARFNLPVPIGPMAQTGMSAPGTLAGTLVQENAEILAGICVTQLIQPGTPVCYGGIPHAFDMRTTQMIFAGPEQALMAVAMTQMGRRYGLPVYINVGLTDSKCVDAQAGLEVAATLLAGALAGADIFGHLGICGVDQATSLDMLVMQHEVIGYVERIMRGIDFSDEALGLDVIAQVGPGGAFIDQEHTARHFRRELWFPRLLDRQFYQAWHDAGRCTMADRCRQMREELLARHEVTPLPRETLCEVDRIVAAARRHLDKWGN